MKGLAGRDFFSGSEPDEKKEQQESADRPTKSARADVPQLSPAFLSAGNELGKKSLVSVS